MWTKRRRGICCVMLTALVLAVAGCATQPAPEGTDLPGFFTGILHGVLNGISAVQSRLTQRFPGGRTRRPMAYPASYFFLPSVRSKASAPPPTMVSRRNPAR